MLLIPLFERPWKEKCGQHEASYGCIMRFCLENKNKKTKNEQTKDLTDSYLMGKARHPDLGERTLNLGTICT